MYDYRGQKNFQDKVEVSLKSYIIQQTSDYRSTRDLMLTMRDILNTNILMFLQILQKRNELLKTIGVFSNDSV